MEVMVASAIILIVLTSVGRVLTSSLVDVSYARQRQVADSLASKAMAEVRALPLATVQAGLLASDLAGDTTGNVDQTSHKLTLDGIDETVPTVSSGTPPAPLYPHCSSPKSSANSSAGLDGTTYQVCVYPTIALDSSHNPTGATRVTVWVSWANPVRQGLQTYVTDQTLLYAPNGCVSNTTHPFGAPCVPFLYGTASLTPGQIAVSGTLNGQTLGKVQL
ncbi:MAG: type IV pilus modification PilV family protein, partial [Acidimicrobiales bacterium]